MGKVGIIGGSGLEKEAFFTDPHERVVMTLWGPPSSALLEGTVEGAPVAILARHGREHTLPPSAVNYRANVQALRDAGCSCILATTAVGSLRREIERGDLIILDQFIDFTRQRRMTYREAFAPHQPMHAPMAEPFDARLREILYAEAGRLNLRRHKTGTVITIEGPRFSTRAESRMFRAWGADVVNMSIATEAALANEIGLPYAAVAMSTDYDAWNETDEAVTWQEILDVFGRNVGNVMRLLQAAIPLAAGLEGS
jgi:5'-methylthioadenosine phosphorylase